MCFGGNWCSGVDYGDWQELWQVVYGLFSWIVVQCGLVVVYYLVGFLQVVDWNVLYVYQVGEWCDQEQGQVQEDMYFVDLVDVFDVISSIGMEGYDVLCLFGQLYYYFVVQVFG